MSTRTTSLTSVFGTLLCGIVLYVVAAPPRGYALPHDRSTWNVFNTKTGSLRETFVDRIAQTKDGSIYISTPPAGIARFHNNEWSSHDKDTRSLADDRVTALVAATDGALWVGTDAGGVSRFDGKNWITYTETSRSIPDSSVAPDLLLQSRDGTIFVRTATSLSAFLNGTWKSSSRLPLRADFKSPPVVITSRNEAWAAHPDGGVLQFSHAQQKLFSANEIGPQFGPVSVIRELGRDLWIGSERGRLARLQEGRWLELPAAEPHLHGERVSHIYRLQAGTTIAHTHTGRRASLLPGGSWTDSPLSTATRDQLLTLLQEAPPAIWISRSISDLAPVLEALNDLPDAAIVSTAERDAVGIVLGTDSGGVLVVENGEPHWMQLGRRRLTRIHRARDRTLWLGTEDGVYRFADSEPRRMETADARHPHVLSILEAADGDMWFGTASDGVLRFKASVAALSVRSVVDGHLPVNLTVTSGRPADTWTLSYRFQQSAGPADGSFVHVPFDTKGLALIPVQEKSDRLFLDMRATDADGTVVTPESTPVRVDIGSPLISGLRKWVLGAATLQVLVWSVALLVYPHSRQVQALFIWNTHFRHIAGLWYVDALITTIPPIARRILDPFKDQLRGGLDLEQAADYYDDTRVVQADGHAQRGNGEWTTRELARHLHGLVVIQGPSGTGKTHFVRKVLREQQGVAVYLPANRCSGGVLEAITGMLPPAVNDGQLLERLIFGGNIRVFIDGLNEIGPDTRGQISAFLHRFSKAHIVVLTQPIVWTPPRHARTFELHKLSPTQITEYLALKCGQDEELAGRCAAFVEEATATTISPDVRTQNFEVLSTPLDLDLVIDLLAAGESPRVAHLQAQYVAIVAEAFQRRSLRKFPLEALAERAYQARATVGLELDPKDFDTDLLEVLVEHRVLLVRRATASTFFFRHERLQDFFVASHLLRNPDIRRAHLGDVRFVGAYILLVDMLPDAEAHVLAADLAVAAAHTRDHTVSDPVWLRVEQLKNRRLEHAR